MPKVNPRDDHRVAVSRYQVDRLAPDSGANAGAETTDSETDAAAQITMDRRLQFVELQVQQAIRRGDFDNLPGAGKPLEDLHVVHDPDWWIRRKVEREQLTGLGPPALTLRTENAALDARLDAAGSERAVRDILDDFNARVIHARRQLQGGPPVVTATRDPDAEVAAWLDRRSARALAERARRELDAAELASKPWRERRRARRR